MIFPDDAPHSFRRTRVKICGITHPDDAALAIALGADALGLNFYPKSLRCLDLGRDGGWLHRLPTTVRRIAVVVNATRDEIKRLLHEGFADAVQFHGEEEAEFCLAFREEGVPYIKAIRVREEGDLRGVERFGADALLVDAYHPKAYGGTGHTVDWPLAARFAAEHPRSILAGGLQPGNVAEAIRQVRPHAVDVASGVELATDPRRKDAVKLRAFFAAVRATDVKVATE